MKLAFFCFGEETVLQESLQYESNVVDVFLHRVRKNENVVEVYKNVLIDDIP